MGQMATMFKRPDGQRLFPEATQGFMSPQLLPAGLWSASASTVLKNMDEGAEPPPPPGASAAAQGNDGAPAPASSFQQVSPAMNVEARAEAPPGVSATGISGVTTLASLGSFAQIRSGTSTPASLGSFAQIPGIFEEDEGDDGLQALDEMTTGKGVPRRSSRTEPAGDGCENRPARRRSHHLDSRVGARG